ncbi:hypothetical protein [Variovorax saccharolyticus]|uniref:hypothetical protein n=1 Tax=Variovorax saccharolyticus TaxID=3053516 RepID=UPI002576BEBF|nr:hypothetical protein [Variovorax sp. J31P216]MDM0030406.1 hypothetical protein [Variovorax sp. J31P216]
MITVTMRKVERIKNDADLRGSHTATRASRGALGADGAPGLTLMHRCLLDRLQGLVSQNAVSPGQPWLLRQIEPSLETLRGLSGLWMPRKQRAFKIHQPRIAARLDTFVQVEGSDRAWFEDQAPACPSLTVMDNATNQLILLHFELHRIGRACVEGHTPSQRGQSMPNVRRFRLGNGTAVDHARWDLTPSRSHENTH